jgi:hypothetical protein
MQEKQRLTLPRPHHADARARYFNEFFANLCH